MTIHRSQPFLAAFNDLEAYLRQSLNADITDGFSWMVKKARQRGLLNDSQEDKLKDYAHLRNAISHGLYYEDEPIAEPTQRVVDDIQKLRDLLLAPPEALEILGQKHVSTVSPESSVVEALDYIAHKDYSQIPVYSQGRFQQLLTSHDVAKWVATLLESGQFDRPATVAQVLESSSDKETVQFFPRDVGAVEVIKALSVVPSNGSRSSAVILTEAGEKDQKPLRIITAADLSKLFKAVN